jgi:hypothetical protein
LLRKNLFELHQLVAAAIGERKLEAAVLYLLSKQNRDVGKPWYGYSGANAVG